MVETVSMMERNYERVLSYRKTEVDGKLRGSEEGLARTEGVGSMLDVMG